MSNPDEHPLSEQQQHQFFPDLDGQSLTGETLCIECDRVSWAPVHLPSQAQVEAEAEALIEPDAEPPT